MPDKQNPLAAAFDAGFVSVKGLMQSTGFSRSKIQGHMKGVRPPSDLDRAAYARALGISQAVFDDMWLGDVTEFLWAGRREAVERDKELLAMLHAMSPDERRRVREAVELIMNLQRSNASAPIILTEVHASFMQALAQVMEVNKDDQIDRPDDDLGDGAKLIRREGGPKKPKHPPFSSMVPADKSRIAAQDMSDRRERPTRVTDPDNDKPKR